MIKTAIPAKNPASISSLITPSPPLTLLSTLPMIDGFQMSKILKYTTESITPSHEIPLNPSTSGAKFKEKISSIEPEIDIAIQTPATSSMTISELSCEPHFFSYSFIMLIEIKKSKQETKKSVFTPKNIKIGSATIAPATLPQVPGAGLKSPTPKKCYKKFLHKFPL